MVCVPLEEHIFRKNIWVNRPFKKVTFCKGLTVKFVFLCHIGYFKNCKIHAFCFQNSSLGNTPSVLPIWLKKLYNRLENRTINNKYEYAKCMIKIFRGGGQGW